MTDTPSADPPSPASPDDDGLKRCARCAAWIPSVATMCSYCGTTSPDLLPNEPKRNAIGLPRSVTVTKFIIAANITYFVFSLYVHMMAPGKEVPLLQVLLTGTGFSPSLYASGAHRHPEFMSGEWWRPVCSMFLHGGAIHLAMNMYSMNNIGPFAERLFGGTRLIVIYMLGGIVAAVSTGVWHAQTGGKQALLVGASGAVFAVVGALMAFLLRRGNQTGRQIGFELAKNAAFMIGIGFVVPIISNAAHVAGFVVGILFGLVVKPVLSVQISPAALRNWALSSLVLTLLCAASLGVGIFHALSSLGASR